MLIMTSLMRFPVYERTYQDVDHAHNTVKRQGSERLRPPHAADALADIAAGKFVVVTDDADRENEGDLIVAADRMTEEAMAFMVSVHPYERMPCHSSFVHLASM